MNRYTRSVALGIAIFTLAACDLPLGPGPADFSTALAGDYYLHRTSAHTVTISPQSWLASTPTIPAKVVECATDGRYILAKRQGLMRRNSTPTDPYEQPDPTVFDYWILDTAVPKVIGPMNLDEFTRQRRAHSIPDTLVLRDIYSFRPE